MGLGFMDLRPVVHIDLVPVVDGVQPAYIKTVIMLVVGIYVFYQFFAGIDIVVADKHLSVMGQAIFPDLCPGGIDQHNNGDAPKGPPDPGLIAFMTFFGFNLTVSAHKVDLRYLGICCEFHYGFIIKNLSCKINKKNRRGKEKWKDPKRRTMGQIKAFLFDMDGTLIDTERYYRSCWPKALAAFGYHMTDEQALSMRSLGRPFAPRRLQGWFGEELDYHAVREKRKELMEEVLKREGIRVKPGAETLLEVLRQKGVITAVVTATDRERADRYLAQTGLAGYFDQVISATSVKEGKPSPDIYLYACETLGLEPQGCAAVEDSPNGILSAYRAGCRVIMVPDQTPVDESVRPYLYAHADNLGEIAGWVREGTWEISQKPCDVT